MAQFTREQIEEVLKSKGYKYFTSIKDMMLISLVLETQIHMVR